VEARSHLNNLHDGEGAVTSLTMQVTEFRSLFITSILLLDIRLPASSNASRSGGTDDRHALDPGIIAVMTNSSSE
jgi:hypothetical protein